MMIELGKANILIRQSAQGWISKDVSIEMQIVHVTR